jgi:hypothetical protein
MTPRPKTFLRQPEWLAAFLITLAALSLHLVSVSHAGGLWRDEVSVVSIATLPTMGEVFQTLPHDHCPILLPAIVRAWTLSKFGASDAGLRLLGIGIGLFLLFSLWAASLMTGKRPPLISLALAGLNFTVIRYGDTIRAYGLATALIVLTLALVWWFLEKPGARRGLLAAAGAVLSVQALYQNAFFVLAICAAGAVVCVRRRQPRNVFGVLSIGLPAALSLLPYVGPIHRAQTWWLVSKIGINHEIFLNRLLQATANLMGVWIVLSILAAIYGLGQLFAAQSEKKNCQSELSLFAGITLVLGLAGFWFFIKSSGLPTKVWYYIPALVFAAVCCDAILPRAHRAARFGILGVTIVSAFLACASGYSELRWRQTNGDLVAAEVSQKAGARDLIVVYPWYDGVTFFRYYTGNAAWTTLPPLADHRFHRYDLLKAELQTTNAIGSVLEQAEAVLRAGNKVWVVGEFRDPPANESEPGDLPPAPNGPRGWYDEPYTHAWDVKFDYFLSHNAASVTLLDGYPTNSVNPLETMTLVVAQGWRPANTHSP